MKLFKVIHYKKCRTNFDVYVGYQWTGSKLSFWCCGIRRNHVFHISVLNLCIHILCSRIFVVWGTQWKISMSEEDISNELEALAAIYEGFEERRPLWNQPSFAIKVKPSGSEVYCKCTCKICCLPFVVIVVTVPLSWTQWSLIYQRTIQRSSRR